MGVQSVPVSKLSDLLRAVVATVSMTGDATPLPIGKAFLSQLGVSEGPRVVFVPEGPGKIGPPPKVSAGYQGSVTWSIKCYVRGLENGEDAGRFDTAEDLVAKIVNVLKFTGGASVRFAEQEEKSPSDNDTHGAEIVFGFRYTYGIPTDHTVWAVPVTPISPPDPNRPQGDTGTTVVVETTIEGSR